MKELTREELVGIVGEETVDKLDNISCHYERHGSYWYEFKSTLSTDDHFLTAYFYQAKKDYEQEGIELDDLDWECEFYTCEDPL